MPKIIRKFKNRSLFEKVVDAFLDSRIYHWGPAPLSDGISIYWLTHSKEDEMFPEPRSTPAIHISKIIDVGHYVKRPPIEIILVEVNFIFHVMEPQKSEIVKKIEKILDQFICDEYELYEQKSRWGDEGGILGFYAITGEK